MLTAFENTRHLASGTVEHIAAAVQAATARGSAVLVLDDTNGRVVDLDLRGSPADVAARHAPKRGRPKLGVKAREVTLLPRHWDWLNAQRGGASAAIRRLVEAALRNEAGADLETSAARDAAYQAATAIAGDCPNYEDAIRALYAGDAPGFAAAINAWPPDIAAYVQRLAEPAFG